MRVEGASTIIGSVLTAAADRRVNADFAMGSPVAGATPSGAPLTPPSTSVEMLVALASVDPVLDRRRKLASVAERGLALLERLHQEAIEGSVMPERLAQLADWAASFALPDDRALADLARDIELRVRVELAKHDIQA